MKLLTLKRFHQDDNGTVGVLRVDDHSFYTLELPWKDNERSVSCIPSGAYILTPHAWSDDNAFKFKKTWEVNDVKGRSSILIHVGNFTSDTDGCILVGMGLSIKGDQKMVTHSRNAVDKLRELIGQGTAVINIEDI